MPEIMRLLLIPVILILLIWLVKPVRGMLVIAALMLWLQTGIFIYTMLPLLQGHIERLTLFSEFSIDKAGALFAVLTQIVVAASLTHANIFFRNEPLDSAEDQKSVRIFYTCSSLFLVAMTSVFFCDNLGFLWISVEATTLCSAPLVYFHRNKNSLEAAWKYLMICSVGIAFALLGTMLVFASSQYGAAVSGTLSLTELKSNAPLLQYPQLRLGFLFFMLGYGTKAGIFPLHCWLPDAHSEAPAPASAMLSGGLLNCALFAIWRLSEVVTASGHQILVQNLAIYAGSLTVFVASLLLIRQHGIKRLFAYSSIENTGLMLIAIGLGSGYLFFFLALNHSVAKVALFLISGNIIQTTATKSLNDIRGILAINPYWSAGLTFAAFAVTGAPPFGSFAAELQLLAQISQSHLWVVLAVLLLSLAVSFLSITMYVGRIVCGTAAEPVVKLPRISSSLIPACLVLIALLCGISAIPKLLW